VGATSSWNHVACWEDLRKKRSPRALPVRLEMRLTPCATFIGGILGEAQESGGIHWARPQGPASPLKQEPIPPSPAAAAKRILPGVLQAGDREPQVAKETSPLKLACLSHVLPGGRDREGPQQTAGYFSWRSRSRSHFWRGMDAATSLRVKIFETFPARTSPPSPTEAFEVRY